MAEERTADLSEALASAQLAWSSSEAREEKAVCTLNEARTAATQERAELESRASTAEDLVAQWKRHYQGKAAEFAALDRLAQDNVAMAADAKAEALAFETDLAAAKLRAERAEESAATATQSLHEAVRIFYVLHYTTVIHFGVRHTGKAYVFF